jgi:hypothetical protein
MPEYLAYAHGLFGQASRWCANHAFDPDHNVATRMQQRGEPDTECGPVNCLADHESEQFET